jgi:hypothetical protein
MPRLAAGASTRWTPRDVPILMENLLAAAVTASMHMLI